MTSPYPPEALPQLTGQNRDSPYELRTPVDPLPILTELNTILHDEQPLRAVLIRLSELARTHIPGADAASITVLREGRPLDAGFTGDLAVALDERQYRPSYGPSTGAARSGDVIHLPDTARDRRYPDYSRLAARHGVRQLMAIGLPRQRTVSAALTIYATCPAAPWHERTTTAAFCVASCVTSVIVNTVLYGGALQEARQLREAMLSRAEIEQAKGMIMLHRRCTSEEAFQELSETSARVHRKLRDVAQDMVRKAGHR